MTEKHPTDPVVEVYLCFKHLDTQILDAGSDDDPYHKTCAVLWVAVKEHCANLVEKE